LCSKRDLNTSFFILNLVNKILDVDVTDYNLENVILRIIFIIDNKIRFIRQ